MLIKKISTDQPPKDGYLHSPLFAQFMFLQWRLLALSSAAGAADMKDPVTGGDPPA